jgi:putative membrane protein
MKDEQNELITRDWLAIERTKLANERTFLAYFRTFIVILGTGITILKIEFFSDLKLFGWILMLISPAILIIGVARLFRVKKTIRNHYKIK